MRSLVLAAVMASAVVGSASGNEYALTRARTLHGQLMDDAQCEAALPSARQFWNSADFELLATEQRQAFLYGIMRCAWTLADGQAAISATNAARELGAPWAPRVQLRLGVAFDNDPLAVSAFEEIVARAPAELAEMESRIVWGVLHAAQRIDASGATALRVHEALLSNNYAYPEGAPDDGLRVAHARLLMRNNQLDRARQRLTTVVEPRLVQEMRINREFDPLRGDAAFESRLNITTAAEAHLARTRAEITAKSRSLWPVLETAQVLRALGRDEEALAELDRAIGKAQGPGGADLFDDDEETLNWLLNEKAYILYDLNRAEEARRIFGLSIAAGENGNWSVSQVINFASMLEAEGRPNDALEVLRVVGRASPYGDMWVASVRACAAEQTGNTALRDEALAFLREHAEDNLAALTRTLICVNALDEVSALFIRRLGDPDLRTDALIALQRYRQNSSPALARRALLLQRLSAVRERADVRAAVDAIGRIEDVPLFTVYWGDV